MSLRRAVFTIKPPLAVLVVALLLFVDMTEPETVTAQTSDRAALVALYNATGGPNWTNDTNWLSGRPIGEWSGVTTVNGRVTELHLWSNQLTGTIPPELGNLSNLEGLAIQDNRLTGEIPAELGNLSNLQYLELWDNQLTGEIPAELGNLSNLTNLDLPGNQLTGTIPPELGSLSNLESLYIQDNRLTGEIPQSFTGLTALERFYFTDNAGLCAPNDEVFQSWLKSVTDVEGDNCSPPDSEEDRAALVALYNTTAGPNWTNNTNWLSDRPMREWYGVTTDDEGRVTHLSFHYDNQLTGTIPPELGSLSNLESLTIQDNGLTGEIPAELGNLSNLTNLNFYGNGLTGEIPAELGILSNLTNLDLRRNPLTGAIPSELGNLSLLERLGLEQCKLTGSIPPELGNLSNLKSLTLGWGNQLTGEIPAELGNLSNLEWLSLSYNQLIGAIPPELGKLSNLKNLQLFSNRLTGTIPAELGSLSNLERLHIGFNQLTGTIPPELGSLSNLEWLHIGFNQLTGTIPPELGSLSNLEWLYMSNNQLTGCVPAGLDIENSDLAQLGLPFCDDAPVFADDNITYTFTAGVPVSHLLPEAANGNRPIRYSISPAPGNGVTFTPGPPASIRASATSTVAAPTTYMLTAIDADGETDTMTVTITVVDSVCAGMAAVSGYANSGIAFDCDVLLAARDTLTGNRTTLNWAADVPIAQWEGVTIGRTPRRVTELNLTWNRMGIRGKIPAALGSLPYLRLLNLSGNQLAGEIPAELGNLSNLSELYLSYNQLTGEIPAEIGNLSNLVALYLSHNQLTGEIPAELGNLSNLSVLSLSENQLTGEIPAEIGNLSNLVALYLSHNQLTGEIPAELGNLSNLMNSLRLSHNQLTGEIPAELGNLSNLQDLHLSYNQLTGEIPAELGNLSNLSALYLSHNQLTGEVPAELGNLSNLSALYLSHNQLTGEVPAELGNLPNLRVLYLSDNQLTGEVPAELGNLSNLQDLNLSYNQLTGEIPAELGNLPNLSALYLSYNQLTGGIPAELGNLSNLHELTLGSNQLTGMMPSELGNLTKLILLDIRENSILDISPLARMINLKEAILFDNNISDIAPLVANKGLASGDRVDVSNNPLNAVSVNTIIPQLQDRGVDVSFGEVLILNDSQIYNDNVFVMLVSEDLASGDLPLEDYAARFYERFNDEFDFLMFVSDLEQGESKEVYGAIHFGAKNDVKGIGTRLFSDVKWGSGGKLQGIIHFAAYASYDFWNYGVRWSIFTDGTPLHELMHQWANFIVPLNHGGHWGFSSADGHLGGFNIDNLVDLGGGKYTAGVFSVQAGHGPGVYSPIELYLAGFIPPEEVPDLWVAEDGQWLRDEDGEIVGADNGYPIFTASKVKTYTIEDIIAQHGPRVPDVSQSQKDFRAAVILLVNDNRPVSRKTLERLSDDVSWLSYAGNDEAEQYNFYEATGGRATIAMDSLSQFQKVPFSPTATPTPTPSQPDNGTAGGEDDSVCVTGGAVPSGSAALIADCETLLSIKSALRGSAKLNWWAGRPIEKWNGIEVQDGRVVELSLPNRNLDGVLPVGLGSLTALKTLDLSGNSLTGVIPASLNNLTALTKWRFAGNGFSGCIPYYLAQVSDSDIASLGLAVCEDS